MLSRGKFSADKLSSGKRWTGTVAGDRGNKAMDVDTVRLLKTQDIGYLRTMRNVAAKEVARLQEKAIIAGAFAGIDSNADDEDEDEDDFDSEEDEATPRETKTSKPKKIVFAESEEEVDKVLPEQDDDDTDMDDDSEDFDEKKDEEKMKKRENVERLRRQLQVAKKKLKAFTDAENELEEQRAKMAKTPTYGGITKKGKKLKIRERKR